MKPVLVTLLALWLTPALAQVTVVSPEEGRKALRNLAPLPPSAAPAPAPARPAPKKGAPLLPEEFAGWSGGKTEVFGAYNAATLAGADAALMVEYGYDGAERRTYQKGGFSVLAEALRMKDSTGSYGLYTYYRGEDWETLDTGNEQIATRGNQILIRKDEALVRLTASSHAPLPAAGVQALISALGTSGGGPLPTLPLRLPDQGLARKSRRYVIGPIAFKRLAGDLPAAIADFEMAAEVMLAQYRFDGKPMTLALLSYPTPQMAAMKLRAWESAGRSNAGGSPVSVLYARRTGPLLVFVSGAPDQAAADRLLSRINYRSEVVWHQRSNQVEAVNFARFILNVFLFIGLLLLFALIAGLGFGAFRVVLQTRYPNRFFGRPEEAEFIRLNINY